MLSYTGSFKFTNPPPVVLSHIAKVIQRFDKWLSCGTGDLDRMLPVIREPPVLVRPERNTAKSRWWIQRIKRAPSRRQVFYSRAAVAAGCKSKWPFLMPKIRLTRLFVVYLVGAYVFHVVALLWVSYMVSDTKRVCVSSVSYAFDVACHCECLFQEREEQRGDAHTILAKHPAGEVFWTLLGVLIPQLDKYLTELMWEKTLEKMLVPSGSMFLPSNLSIPTGFPLDSWPLHSTIHYSDPSKLLCV